MRYSPLLFSIIGLQSLLFFFPEAFAQDQNPFPLMMGIREHGERKGSSSTPRGHEELQHGNENNNNSSLTQREMLDHGGPREIISEEENFSSSQENSLPLANPMDNSPRLVSGLPKTSNQLSFPASLPTHRDDKSALRIFLCYYTRSAEITKRREACQEELKRMQKTSFSPQREDHIFFLEKLIPLLEQARIYQDLMVNHLIKSQSPDPIIQQLQLPYILSSSLKINNTLNKIERIAEQLGQDHFHLMDLHIMLQSLEYHIATLPLPEAIPLVLEQVKTLINEAMGHQRNLIEQKAAYAQTSHPPYEQVDAQTQVSIEELAISCRREQNLYFKKQRKALDIILNNRSIAQNYYHQRAFQANQAAEKEAQQPQRLNQIIDKQTLSANFWTKVESFAAAGHLKKAFDLSKSAFAFDLAIREAQQLQPRKQVLDFYTQAADYYRKILAMKTAGYFEKANYIERSASALIAAATETQQLQPRRQAIELYTQLANSRRQLATESYCLDDTYYLCQLDSALNQAATEALEQRPRKQVIALYTQAADSYNKVVTLGVVKFSKNFLIGSANARYEAAKEAQNSQPREQVIELFTQASDCYDQATAAYAAGDPERADYLQESALALHKAAIEAQKPQLE